jgi:hypothetical protein
MQIQTSPKMSDILQQNAQPSILYFMPFNNNNDNKISKIFYLYALGAYCQRQRNLKLVLSVAHIWELHALLIIAVNSKQWIILVIM